MNEAMVTVNGTPLTDAQVMTMRVALTSFMTDMKEPNALGNDEHGLFMAKSYHEKATQILRQMNGH